MKQLGGEETTEVTTGSAGLIAEGAATASYEAGSDMFLGATAVVGVDPVSELAPDAQTLLSSEQQLFADAVVGAMSETLGIAYGDVRLVLEEVPAEGLRRVVAIDASPNGQHIGNYKKIMEQRQADPEWYTILVGDERIDPLVASTDAAYRAMIADARSRGVELLPDSLALSQQNDELWTATMVLGEASLDEGLVPVLSTSSDKVNKVGFRIDRGGRSIRVRPAVVIAQFSE